MAYPPAPWHLVGHGVQTIHLVPTAAVRALVPPELDIVAILPGRTLAVVAFAHYGSGSVLEYDELIVAPAVVKRDGKAGVWISHIYVSHPDSVAGGREIWGVPKFLASFEWSDSGSRRIVSATMDGRRLCAMTTGRRLWLIRKRLEFPSYSRLGSELLRFVGETRSRVALTRGKVEVPDESPFSEIPLGRAYLGFWLGEMDLVCHAPTIAGQTAPVAA